jgi:hypothetical protein
MFWKLMMTVEMIGYKKNNRNVMIKGATKTYGATFWLWPKCLSDAMPPLFEGRRAGFCVAALIGNIPPDGRSDQGVPDHCAGFQPVPDVLV